MTRKGEYETRDYLAGKRMADLAPREDGKVHTRPHDAPHTEQSPLAGMAILVLDDDTAVVNSMADLLRAEKCIVHCATRPSAAFGILRNVKLDAVISDVVMPEMDGYDFYLKVKEDMPSLPVILMTAYYYDKDHILKRIAPARSGRRAVQEAGKSRQAARDAVTAPPESIHRKSRSQGRRDSREVRRGRIRAKTNPAILIFKLPPPFNGEADARLRAAGGGPFNSESRAIGSGILRFALNDTKNEIATSKIAHSEAAAATPLPDHRARSRADCDHRAEPRV